MKQKRVVLILGLILLALASVITGIFLQKKAVDETHKLSAASGHEPRALPTVQATLLRGVVTPAITASEHPLSTGTALPSGEFQEQRQTINGILFTATHLRRSDSKVWVDLCFSIPDNRDWMIDSVVFQMDEIKVENDWGASAIELVRWPVNGIQQISDFEHSKEEMVPVQGNDAGTYQTPHRCDAVYSRDVDPSRNYSKITLTIPAVQAFPREGEVCDAASLERVQKALDARNLAIKVQCQAAQQAAGLVIVEKPETMTLEEAEKILHEHDFQIDVNGIRGPWIFTYSFP